VSGPFVYPPMTSETDALGCDIYRTIPLSTLEALDRYLTHGIYGGGALDAVLTNNLLAAVRCGDEATGRALVPLVRYLYNRCPMSAWGSVERVERWVLLSDEDRWQSYMRHCSHGEYLERRRQQAVDFAASCRDNDKA
jgi:hypothetical protein